MAKHADDDGDGLINRLDPDAPEFEGAVVDELGGEHPRRLGAARGLTAETLSAAMGASLPLARYRALLPSFASAMVSAGCTTEPRAIMWDTQVGHETVGLKYLKEIWGPSKQQLRYDPASGSSLAKELGNTQRGDGERYLGRGALMVTGRGNYGVLSLWAYRNGYVPTPTYFVDNPEQLATDRYAFLSAIWYWTTQRPLNRLSDANDLEGATRAVNGGLTGIDDRRRRWGICRRLGAALLPGSSPTPPAASRRKAVDMAERSGGPGNSGGRITMAVGGDSATIERAWLNFSVDGRAHLDAWFQRPGAGISEVHWDLDGPLDFKSVAIPDGTKFVTFHVINANGPWSLVADPRARA